MTEIMTSSRLGRIRQLNDEFRRSFRGGQVMLTPGILGLPPELCAEILQRVASFTDFTDDNDPHGEHDFVAFDLAGQKIFAKIDYYDLSLETGSEDPADPAKTTRVLTIMLASEY